MSVKFQFVQFCCDYCNLEFTQDRYPEVVCPIDHFICHKCIGEVEIELRNTRFDDSMECLCCQAYISSRSLMNFDFMFRLKVMAEIVIGQQRLTENERQMIEVKKERRQEIDRLKHGRKKFIYDKGQFEMFKQKVDISKWGEFSFCGPSNPPIKDIPEEEVRILKEQNNFLMDEIRQLKADFNIFHSRLNSEFNHVQQDIYELKSKHYDDFSLKRSKRQRRQRQYSPIMMMMGPTFRNHQDRNGGIFSRRISMQQSYGEKNQRDFINTMARLEQRMKHSKPRGFS